MVRLAERGAAWIGSAEMLRDSRPSGAGRPYSRRLRSCCLRLAAALGAAVISAAPAAAAPPPDDIDSYPLAHGNYTAPDNYGWLYFKTPGGWGCGIGPNGGPVGCDAVAGDAPPGTNQTYAIIYAPGQ